MCICTGDRAPLVLICFFLAGIAAVTGGHTAVLSLSLNTGTRVLTDHSTWSCSKQSDCSFKQTTQKTHVLSRLAMRTTGWAKMIERDARLRT